MQLPTLTILRRLSVDERSSAGVLLGQEAEDDALENVRGLTADAVAYAVEYYQLGSWEAPLQPSWRCRAQK